MVRFQEGIKIKLLEIGTSIEVKCRKAVESKMGGEQENSSKQANKQRKQGKNSEEHKVLYALPGSYSVKNDTAILKK